MTIEVRDSNGRLLTIGSGAPTNATYVVMSLDGTLTSERVLSVTAGDLVLTDGGAGGTANLNLDTTTVVAGTYGDATNVSQITFDAKGRATAATNVSIAIPHGQITDWNEAVDDRVAALIIDSATITWTYNDGANTLSAAVTAVPPGVIALTDAHILVGNAANVAADVAMSGVIAITNAGVTSFSAGTTGAGAVVLANTPTLITPVLGVATATSINGLTITASTGTLTIANGKTATISNTLTFTGTDGSSVAFSAGGTVTYTSNKLSVFAATTSAELAGVISDETGTGVLVYSTSPSITTPNIIGTVTNDNAAAGSVGEEQTQSRLRSAATAMTTSTPLNVTATPITLQAGDYDISAMVGYLAGTGTNATTIVAGISLTSATLPSADVIAVPTSGEARINVMSAASFVIGTNGTLTGQISSYRVSLPGATTLYLVAQATFTVSTLSVFGSITTRRRR